MPDSWKTVRVFISSTFRDMQAERDYLVRFIFPRLREQLFPLHIYFVDVDLRWGITSEQDALEVCREIIDECQPRFLCMLGGRYGWVPPGKTHSITADEIHYGVLHRSLINRGFSHFYFRDDAATATMTETIPGEFREPQGSENEKKLFELKKEIIDAGLNPITYPALWDNESNRLTGLKIFGDHVYNDLLSSIRSDPELQDRFTTNVTTQSNEFDEENQTIKAFTEERSEHFILGSRKPVLEELLAHASAADDARYVCVHGASGSGKSAMLAYLSRHPDINDQPSTLLIRHFVGASPRSTDIRQTLRRLCHELKTNSPGVTTEVPDDPDKLRTSFPDFLQQACAIYQRVVILLDAVNQFDQVSYSDGLRWLPDDLPSNARFILSAPEGPVLDNLSRHIRMLRKIELKPLTTDDSKAIIEQFLQRYRKKFSGNQIELLLGKNKSGTLNKADADKPLYLLTALEELRTLGSYEEITQRISELPPTTHQLFAWILERLKNDDGFRNSEGKQVGHQIVPSFASLLGVSRYGLSHRELVDLLDPQDLQAVPAIEGDPQGNVAALLHLLRPFLMHRGELLDFYHGQFRKAVEDTWLEMDTQRQTSHSCLVNYFGSQPYFFAGSSEVPRSVIARKNSVNSRAMDELPWQLAHISAYPGCEHFAEQLKDVLCDLRFIEAKCLDGKPYDLESDYISAFQVFSRSIKAKVPADRQDGFWVRDRLNEFAAFVSAASHLLAEFPHETIPIARQHAKGIVAEQAATLCAMRDSIWFAVDPKPKSRFLTDGYIRTLRHAANAVVIDATGNIAVSAGKNSLRFWNLETGASRYLANGHRDDIHKATMTPDGQIVVTGGGTGAMFTAPGKIDGAIIVSPVLDSKTGRPQDIIPDYTLRVWEVQSGECIAELKGHSDRIAAIAISADGTIVVSASWDQTIRLWDVKKAACIRTIRNHLQSIETLSIDASLEYCIVVCGDGKLHIWNIRQADWQFVRSSSKEKFLAAAITPDARFIYAITKISLETWTVPLIELQQARSSPEVLKGTLTIAPLANIAVTSTENHDLLVWYLDDHTTSPRLIEGAGSNDSLAITPDARILLAAKSDTIECLDPSASYPVATAEKKAPNWYKLSVTAPDGSLLARELRNPDTSPSAVFRVVEGEGFLVPKPSDPFEIPGGKLMTSAFLSSGRLLVTLNHENHLNIWNVQTGTHLLRLNTAGLEIGNIIPAREADIFITNADKDIYVWDSNTEECKHVLRDHKESIDAMVITCDGRVAVSGGGEWHDAKEPGDYDLRVWDLFSGTRTHTLRGHASPIIDVTVDRYGWAAASIGDLQLAGEMRFWDIGLGLCFRRHLISPMSLHGHGGTLGFVKNIVFAPDGATVIVGGFNNDMKGIQVYNFRTQALYRIPGCDRLMSKLSFVYSGRLIIGSAWGSRQIQVWDFVTSELLGTCVSPPQIGDGDFSWIENDLGCCICPNDEGGFSTLKVHNLPPRELSTATLITDMASSDHRRKLTALWYAIDHPNADNISEGLSGTYYNSILDLVCLADEDLLSEELRHAAVKAAQRAGLPILQHVLARIAHERSWQATGNLALILGQLAKDSDFIEIRPAFKFAAGHPDVRVRKRVALALRYIKSSWSDLLLGQIMQSDRAIDNLIYHIELGTATASMLDETDSSVIQHSEPLTDLCPTALSDVAANTDLYKNKLPDMTQQARITHVGRSHPYLEQLLLQRQLDNAVRLEDFESAATFHDNIFYTSKAHDHVAETGKETMLLFDRLAELNCISIPVARVVAGLLRNSAEETKNEKLIELKRCIDFVDKHFEPLNDFKFRSLCAELMHIETPGDLFKQLGIYNVAQEREFGLGTAEWSRYAFALQRSRVRQVYCLANRYLQIFPNEKEKGVVRELIVDLGWSPSV